jgi:hypothetical protein
MLDNRVKINSYIGMKDILDGIFLITHVVSIIQFGPDMVVLSISLPVLFRTNPST